MTDELLEGLADEGVGLGVEFEFDSAVEVARAP